ncbi:hypothetical protein [Nocardioides silvaticus]|uniref:hypothetical protein n=1 Tax=Nocardioides silvaticus TaxID=2201891 RepID=UPI0011B1EA0C|nr:hypothetical protein [Nocardioides silvaticus]
MTIPLADHAAADEWPADVVGGIEPDRGDHTYCFRDVNPPNNLVKDRIDWSMGTLRDQTVVPIQFHSNCTSQTDARWEQVFYQEGVSGVTNCIDLNTNGRCDQWRIRVSYGEIQQYAADPPAETRHTTCHELGHSVALDHYGATSPDGAGNHSCMRSGLWDGGQEWTRTYGPHHINHINSNW